MIFFCLALLLCKLGQEILWHTNLQTGYPGSCRGNEALSLQNFSFTKPILSFYMSGQEGKHWCEPAHLQRSNYVVALVYFCQSKHIKKSMQTLLVRSNLTPVGETTMNEENSLQNNSDKSIWARLSLCSTTQLKNQYCCSGADMTYCKYPDWPYHSSAEPSDLQGGGRFVLLV